MLNSLKITNLALVEQAFIEFGPAFNVITGESGAGKSICIGALGLLLGSRSDKGVIRTGCDRCEIAIELTVSATLLPEIKNLLAQSDIEISDDVLSARKVITPSSCRNYLNGVPVSARTLQDTLSRLIDLQNPLDQLSLGSKSRQLALLDRYAGVGNELLECAKINNKIMELNQELTEFSSQIPFASEFELAKELLDAVKQVSPEKSEDVELEARHALFAHSRQILETGSKLVNLLTEADDSLADRMAEANRLLEQLSKVDEKSGGELAEQGALLSEKIRELAADVECYAASVDIDEAAFAAMEERLGKLYALKRRYGPSLKQVLEKRDQAEMIVTKFQSASKKKSELASAIAVQKSNLNAAAQALSLLRQSAATKFAHAVLAKLGNLGFKQCRLVPAFTNVEPSSSGMDELDWQFSANAGETPRPLRQIASSGERSRLFLAMKEVLAQADEIPVVVFDEIDVNIGGITANRVAEALHELGQNRQILCISHLAQVASRADDHFVVDKQEQNGRTFSTVSHLDLQGRQNELARMLGAGRGAEAHAQDLLQGQG